MADFDAPILCQAVLARIQLPTKTLRLCDGAFVYWGTEKYTSADDEFGSVGSVETLEERRGDEAPDGRLVFLPLNTAAAATLSRPEYQGSPLQFWLARVNEQTGRVEGDPELLFNGELDSTTLRVGKKTRFLDMEFVSAAKRLFNVNSGNVLSTRHHQSVWSGELGLDNAGAALTIPWGTESPPRAAVTASSSGAGFRDSAVSSFLTRLR